MATRYKHSREQFPLLRSEIRALRRIGAYNAVFYLDIVCLYRGSLLAVILMICLRCCAMAIGAYHVFVPI